MLLLKKMSHVLISMMENGKWKFKSQKKKKKKKKKTSNHEEHSNIWKCFRKFRHFKITSKNLLRLYVS